MAMKAPAESLEQDAIHNCQWQTSTGMCSDFSTPDRYDGVQEAGTNSVDYTSTKHPE